MIVPGSNLLQLALSVQGQQKVVWRQFTGRTTNAKGILVSQYADPVDVYGSFQPMSRRNVMANGYDLEKSYATFYASKPFDTAGRDRSGDVFDFNGSRWQAADDMDWFAQDGWDAMIMVRTGPTP